MTSEFEFDLDSPRRRVTRDQAIVSLRKYAKGRPLPYTVTDYRSSKPSVSVDTLVRLFGSFRLACEAAGLQTGTMKREFSDDELLDAFTAICRDRHGRGLSAVPSASDFGRYRESTGPAPSYSVFVRRFGPFSAFKKLFAQFHQKSLTRPELIRKAKANLRATRLPISTGLRSDVLRRDGSRCVTCGRGVKQLGGDESMHVDHRLPVAIGGTTELDNLQTKCSSCNLGKGARFKD